MLSLTRKKLESLTIITPEGRTIVVFVSRINGNRTTLGVEADREVRVVRSELRDKERAA